METNPSNNFNELINKIRHGLSELYNVNRRIFQLRSLYNNFSKDQRDIIDLYLAWMFMYSMYMRFWRGPGHNWPITKTHIRQNGCFIEERDINISIQETVRTSIIQIYGEDPVLSEWINSLPIIHYDFNKQDVTCSFNRIKDLLDEIARGRFCMGIGSDKILKTSYYYIVSILNKSGLEFDEFINTMIPKIIAIEHMVVIRQLEFSSQFDSIRYIILNSRIQKLQEVIPLQQGFDPTGYQNNIHTD